MEIQKLMAAAGKHAAMIEDTMKTIWAHPETGYKEWNTHRFVKERFETLGYEPVEAGDITGFYCDLDTGRPGPTVAFLAELDSVICHNHPAADPVTGAVHACGHCAQIAGLVGLAAALKEPGMLEAWSGKIRLMVVPAEELIELGYRDTLRDKGLIHYYGGKVEYMYRGFFDDVDIAMMIHTTADLDHDFIITTGGNGCLLKNITYEGKASHAGGAPHLGINALYAANLGINAVNALRETFQEKDYVRFHPIITEGGQIVNAIPDTVKVESYVRGASLPAILESNKKINRALAASAAALGANVILGDRPGYAPLNNDKNMIELCGRVLSEAFGADQVVLSSKWDTGSTDMGDVSTVMPAIQVYACGAQGHGHGADYEIVDIEKATVNASKAFLLTVNELLKDDAAQAKKVIAEAEPVFGSIKEYFETMDKVFMDLRAVEYQEDGSAVIRWEQA